MNRVYDRFVQAYGPINKTTISTTTDGTTIRRMPNLVTFRDDPDAMLVMALEHYDERTGLAKKAAILHHDVVGRHTPRTAVQSAEEGLLVSLDQRGIVDLPFIATLYGAPVRQIIAELGDLIYQDPDTQAWHTADVYLSGNVRAKLAAAERAGAAYARNVEALRAVQPEDVLPGDIDAHLGAPWIPESDIQAFAAELFSAPLDDLTVVHLTHEALWSLDAGITTTRSVAATTEYGTVRANGVGLLEQALNLKSPTIYDVFERDGKEERVLNQEETLAARDKQKAIKERLRACGPWGQTMRRRMLPLSAVEPLPAGRRFVVIDASSMQAPGTPGTDHRLHIAMDLVSLPFLEVLVSDVHPGETRKHCTVAPGAIAVADRGYAHCQGMRAALQQGADLIVRFNPFSVVLCDAVGVPLELCAALTRQHLETLRTLAVALCATGGQHAVRGWVHAYRLNAEHANRARHTCRQGPKKGPPTAESLRLAGWVLVLTTLAPAVLSAQTIMALYRGRWPVDIAIKRWKSVLAVDALRAKAHSPLAAVWLHGKWLDALLLERRMRRQLGDRWGRLDQERVGTWWRVWGMLKDERAPRMTGALFGKEDAWAACLKGFMERPRRRT